MNKAQLLREMREGFDTWQALLDRVGMEHMGQQVHDDGWTARDLAAHQVAYDYWTAGQLESLLRGTPATVRELYDTTSDNDLDVVRIRDLHERNAAFHEIYRDRSAEDVRAAHRAAFERMYQAIEALSEEQLADPNLWELTGGRSLLDVMPNQTYLHYGRHTPRMQELAERLEAARGQG